MTDLQKLTLAIANELIGIKEETGHNDGPFLRYIQRYTAKRMGMGLADLDNQPWCAMFATWCVDQAAYLLRVTQKLPVMCSSQSLYAWGKEHALLLPRPMPGCMGLLRGGPNGHQHTFLVTDILADHVVTLDGNESNQVIKTTHPTASCDFLEIQ